MMPVVPDVFPGVTQTNDVEEADWVRESLRPWPHPGGTRVAMFVPATYPAHARILHRARSTRTDLARWAELAATVGKQLEADTSYPELVGWTWDPEHQTPPEPWLEPEAGTLRRDECVAVAEVLTGHTTTPDDCWFCVWEGYGWSEIEAAGEGARRVHLQHRNCVLFRGPVGAATAFRMGFEGQSPTLWWPADRAWCVASELDIYSTYVGATPAAVRALIDHPVLEVLECTAETRSDRIPPWPP